MGKYDPLERFLNSVDAPQLRVSFAEIERILKFKLPDSAYRYPAWWSNDESGHSHARAWLQAGWRTSEVDVARQMVTLVRGRVRRRANRGDRWGCMAGTVRIATGTDLIAPTGEAWAAEDGRLTGE